METTVFTHKHKLAFLICYFGESPWFFPFFLKSCITNTGVDFIFVTDMEFKDEFPPHMKFIKSSRADLEERCRKILGLELCLIRGYKVCDVRPAFGVLYADLLEEYDFWGYCDTDVIFGNIRSFITSDMLDTYDVISAEILFVCGYFVFFRNNSTCNNLFKQSRSYKQVLESPISYCFDETNWQYDALDSGKSIFELNCEIESLTEVVLKLQNAGTIKALFHKPGTDKNPGKLKWDNGELTYNDKKVLLYHLLHFKKIPTISIPKWPTVPDTYYIHSHCFSTSPSVPLTSTISRYYKKFSQRITFPKFIFHYIKWLIQSLQASKNIRYNEISHLNQLAGDYQTGSVILSIRIVNDRLHATLRGTEYPLLHSKAHTFMIEKPNYGEVVNAIVEFNYNKRLQDYIVRVISSGHVDATLFKSWNERKN